MRSWGQGERAIFQEIMAKSFPEVKAHSQEAQQITPGFKKKKKIDLATKFNGKIL